MKDSLKYTALITLVTFFYTIVSNEAMSQSCTKTSKGIDRCRTELDGSSITIDNDPVTKRIVARYLTFERRTPPSDNQITLFAKAASSLGTTSEGLKKITALWLRCMNDGDTIGAVETNGMTWSFSNPIDDICGIDILASKGRGRAY